MKPMRIKAHWLNHPHFVAALALALGIALTAVAVNRQLNANTQTARARFNELTQGPVARLAERMRSYEYALLGARSTLLADDPMTMTRQRYDRSRRSRNIEREFPGARTISVIWRVPTADEPAFVAAARKDVGPGFRVRQATPHEGERYVLTYAAPMTINADAIGMDFASEPARRGALDTAMRSGAAVISAPIEFFDATEPGQHDFLLVLPVYRPGAPTATEAERVAATVGWTGAPLRIEKLLASLALDDSRLTLSLDDLGDTQGAFFATPGASEPAAGGLVQRVDLPIYGRTWTVEMRARPLFLQELGLPDARGAAAFGGLLALLSSGLVWLLAQSALNQKRLNITLENRVAERTASLESAHHKLQTIIDAMPSTIAYWDRQGLNRFANRAYLDWLGVDPDALRGQPVQAALGAELYERNRPFVEAALRGERQTLERALPRRDGSGVRHVLVHYLPDTVAGQVEGFYVFAHDVSELVEGRSRLAAAQRETEALLSTIDRHTLVSVADPAGRIIDANEAFCRISGYRRDELLGHDHRLLGSGTQDPAFWTRMWTTITAGQPWRGEICNRARDGSLYWVDSIIAPIAGADGAIEKYIAIRVDVTAAKLAEQELRASKAFLDRAGRIAGVGGWELDLRTNALTWTEETFRIHDLPVTCIPDPAQVLDFYAPEGRPVIEAALARAAADGTPWDLELPFLSAQGRQLWVRVQGQADIEDGRAIRLVGAFQDITERKQADALLKLVNDRFAIAADSAHIGVWEWDLTTGQFSGDDRMYRLYGRPRMARIEPYSVWATSLHPDDRARIEAALQASLHGQAAYDLEFRILWPNGEERHLRANARVIRDAAGAPLRMTGVNIDITERKRAEVGLLATASLLDTVLKSASEVSIIASDPQHRITVFNAGAQRMLGYAAEEIVGRATPLLLHDAEEMAERTAELSRQSAGSIEDCSIFSHRSALGTPREWTYVRKDGSRLQVSLVVTEMRAADGTLLGFLGIAHDVTVRKEQEASMRIAMHRAKHANAAKSQFLANMTHEIRTPMNAVIGLTYLLAQSALDAEQTEMIDKLHFAAKSLLRIIDDVLDLSKIEAGELELEATPFALATVLHELSGMMSVQAQAKRIGFSVEVPPDLPAALIGDPTRLGQVLTNLVANAIKFTDRGSVTLVVQTLHRDGDTLRLRFDVTDSGIGIEPEVQARLFAPFVQADASTKRRFGGTGLGLSIVKRVVTAMAGTVGLQSTPGHGSTFRVELNFRAAEPDSLSQPAALDWRQGRTLQGMRVLVTDDSEINLEVAKRILELEGAAIVLARNGQEAVDLLRAQPTGFDAVLMDVQMPVLDGHEATQRIRGELGLARLPVIALTAGALTNEHQRAGAAGMDAFVTKPFDAQSLVRTLLRHTRSAPVIGAPPAACRDAAAWPEIEGIDTEDVRARLGDDLDLFASMLRRLLGEFGDLAPDPRLVPGDIDTQTMAARMHKLKGSASMLGAKDISQLAERAETASLHCEATRLRQWLHKLSLKIERLRSCSEAALEAPEDAAGESAADALAPVDRSRLAQLLALLDQQSLSALDCFKELAPQLRQRLGQSDYRQMQQCIQNLQFPKAAEWLSAI